MGVGATLGNAVLDFALRGTIPAFMSLHTAEPQPGVDLHEVTGTGYGREALAPTDWAAATGGTITTVNAVTFSPAGAAWGTVAWVGLYDAATGGNILWWGPLGTPRAISSGDTIVFPPGNLTGQAV